MNENHVSSELLTVLASTGDWMSHTDIAQALGKRRLDAGRVMALKLMAGQQMIESRKVENDTPIGYRLEYRVIKEGNS